MSKYTSYLKKADGIARAALADLKKARDTYDTASRKYQNVMQSSSDSVERARANANYLEAQEAYEKAKATCAGRRAEIDAVRAEVEAAAKAGNLVDPAKLDAATMELLKSGILTGADYAKLAQDARQAGNATMLRMIGKYAKEAADATTDSREETALRDVCTFCANDESAPYTIAIDKLCAVFDTCITCPGFGAEYDGLIAEAFAGL